MVVLHGTHGRGRRVYSLIVIRFLFGAGEAGALPNSARILREWFPDSSRGRAQGIVTTAMLLGGAASYTTSQWLIDRVGWRWSFAVFAWSAWAGRSPFISGSATIRPSIPRPMTPSAS